MRNRSLTTDVLADKIAELLLSPDTDIAEVSALLIKELPSLSATDAVKVAMLTEALAVNKCDEGIEIVTTTPVSFRTKGRKTRPVIEELISSAQKSIVLTGYSISDHFDDLLNQINAKSKCGVCVELFINNYEKHKNVLHDIEHKDRRYFKVHKYAGNPKDKMAALHAKTIIIDEEKTFISSANLSYHGLDGNIEIGTLITSKEKAAQILAIFAELKRQKIFELV